MDDELSSTIATIFTPSAILILALGIVDAPGK
jgi:hypothetical protein